MSLPITQSLFLQPLMDALKQEQDTNAPSQIHIALCLGEAVEAAPDPERRHSGSWLLRLVELLKNTCKAPGNVLATDAH